MPEDIEIVWCKFTLEEEDKKCLKDMLQVDPSVEFQVKTLELTKYFDGRYKAKIDDQLNSSFGIPSDWSLDDFDKKVVALITNLETKAKTHYNVHQIINILHSSTKQSYIYEN
jgi:hypothetical protein